LMPFCSPFIKLNFWQINLLKYKAKV